LNVEQISSFTYWTFNHNYFYRSNVRATCVSSSFFQWLQSDPAYPHGIFGSTRTSAENVPQLHAGF